MEQIEILRFTLETLERLTIPYALVGSYGSSIYGEPRFTRDIDILMDLPETKVHEFCAAFGASEFFVSEAAIRDAIQKRFQFNVLHPASGNKIDFIFPRDDPWGRTQLSRSKRILLQPNWEGNVAAPEDVIIGKLWYFAEGGGDRHLRDITGIMRVLGEALKPNEVERWAKELGYWEIWQQVKKRVEGPDQDPGPGIP